MGGYNVVAGFLIFFFLFIYFVWFGTSLKIESDKDKKDDIKMNAMNTNSNVDEEETKINTLLYELNSNKSIITENIIDLTNLYNKIKLIRETDILVLNTIKKNLKNG